MRREGQVLFDHGLLQDHLDERRTEMQDAIVVLEPDEALRATEEELARRFASQYLVRTLVLDFDNVTLETPVETHLGDRRGRGVPAMRYEFRIPLDGDVRLLECRRSGGIYHGIVQGQVVDGGQALALAWTVTEHERDQLAADRDTVINEVRYQIDESNKVVEAFNRELLDVAKACVATRRDKVRRDADFAATLGYPLRRHEEVPPGVAVPLKRRVVAVQRRRSDAPGPVEPFLTEASYNEVLDVLADMSVVMERSPHAFQSMGEEALRFVLLVPLNAVFKGETAAEAFNYMGKTDIALLAEGRCVFVAECFVWDGPRSMLDKIEQLRGYATWRNTKLGLIVFSRREGFSSVLEKIKATIEKAPGFVRSVDYDATTGFRCVITHRDDSTRELVLTVLAFDIPVSSAS